jgi:hypothetical protein
MFEIFLIQFLGWPAMILSLVFAFAGILFKSSGISSLGAILLLGPAWYLSHYSIIFMVMPLLLFSAAYAVSKRMVSRAVLLIVPVFAAIAGLGLVVLTQ